MRPAPEPVLPRPDAVQRYAAAYKNVSGVAFPYSRFWVVVAAWLVTGLAIVVVSPGLARRIGASLARDEGLEPELSEAALQDS